MKRIYIILFASVLLLSGCTPREVSYKGDEAELLLNNSQELIVEIIAVTDTALIFCKLEKNAPYYYVPKNDIHSLSVEGYAGDNWMAAVLLGQCVPVVLLTVAAVSVEDGNAAIAVVFALPAAFSFLIFGSTEGDAPKWEDNGGENMELLRKYARYPDGLNEARLLWLLNSKNQKELIRYQ